MTTADKTVTKRPPRAKPEPGPKPDFFVVEDHLKCQTPEGEVSLDLRIPIERLELFMNMDEIDEKLLPKYLREEILWPEDRDKIVNMRDGAKAFGMLMRYAEEVGKRMGAGLGESSPSTSSSEDTEGQSASTSDATSA
ncbi:hypothetical protein [Microbacterium sp. Leaf436]|uniref:hypothetical protein n=1 Tax=Microbacterium sp. Leaf436 TaxID=1736377 RepID=UPI0006F57A69|nr:hypothetical protein [Microbacterium sp. Leaf436]KQT75404.1 hypothetical protein ASG45_02575 [Microbacterium sp. Leaf436]